MVLDSAASAGLPTHDRIANSATLDGKALLLLSGNSLPSITKMAENYGQYLEKNPVHRDAMVYTLASRRERLKLASYCVVTGLKLSEPAPPVEDLGVRRVVFVFTGQGAQWAGMGREMMLENAPFAESVRRMDAVLRLLEYPPEWSLEGRIS